MRITSAKPRPVHESVRNAEHYIWLRSHSARKSMSLHCRMFWTFIHLTVAGQEWGHSPVQIKCRIHVKIHPRSWEIGWLYATGGESWNIQWLRKKCGLLLKHASQGGCIGVVGHQPSTSSWSQVHGPSESDWRLKWTWQFLFSALCHQLTAVGCCTIVEYWFFVIVTKATLFNDSSGSYYWPISPWDSSNSQCSLPADYYCSWVPNSHSPVAKIIDFHILIKL